MRMLHPAFLATRTRRWRFILEKKTHVNRVPRPLAFTSILSTPLPCRNRPNQTSSLLFPLATGELIASEKMAGDESPSSKPVPGGDSQSPKASGAADPKSRSASPAEASPQAPAIAGILPAQHWVDAAQVRGPKSGRWAL